MRSRLICLAVILLLISAVGVVAQTAPTAAPQQATKPEIKHVPAAYTDPSSGKAMYTAYCASCHGADGKGDGPAAPALKMPATNLTTLSVKNNGTFPAAHVAAMLQGDSLTAAHGSKDMPVWGPIFRSMGSHSQAQVQLRIRNLTNYLESIQAK
jgi:mono/diheme cytochrome c family protein